MSQIVQLKRSALSGKVPGTGSLNLGELALNTYDGKIFFRRSGSTDTIQEVVTTNSVVTGSIRLEGTGSFGSLKVNDTLTINHGETIISGSALVTNDLTILGAVNARQFNISVISSSVLFESGSSRFGNTSDDTHAFTGSVNITGSLYLNGVDLSQGNNSGSFSGSFQGDGSGLRGVVSDDIPRDGWDYNANSSASISDFNAESDKYHIDFAQSQSTEVGTPVGYKGFLTNVSGSTQILPTLDGIDFVVGNNVVASIGVGGIIAQATAGTVSGSSQLTSSYDSRYVLSGSITQTTWDNIASKPSGIVSGSLQIINILDSLNTFTASQSTASLVTSITNLNTATSSYEIKGRGIVSGSSQIIDILGALNTFSASASSSLGNIQNYTSSLRAAFTASGANVIFGGNVTIPGNLTIVGTQTIVDSTTIQLGDNIIELNGTGVANGGLLVKDPTAPNTVSGSLLWDSTNDYWKAGALGAESKLLRAEGDSIVSGSSQINFTQLSGISNGIVSGSSQITPLLPTGVVSGSTQTIANLPTGTVSGSSQINVMSTTNIARLATTGSNSFTGNQTITGTINTISIPNDLFAFQFLLMGG